MREYGDSRQIAHLRSFFVPLVLYFALAILMTLPLALYLTRAVPGNGVDSWVNMWNLWWLRRALIHGDDPYFTPMLYYPQGASLLLHTLNPINFLITLPVIATQMLGDPFCRLLPINFSLPCLSLLPNLAATYNAAILASLTLCGLCTYLLALDVTGSRPAALVGGVWSLRAAVIFSPRWREDMLIWLPRGLCLWQCWRCAAQCTARPCGTRSLPVWRWD
jgi:hypothetical protein